jgi:hypothetical protein
MDSRKVSLATLAARRCSTIAVGIVKRAAQTKTRNTLSDDVSSLRLIMKKYSNQITPGATPMRT